MFPEVTKDSDLCSNSESVFSEAGAEPVATLRHTDTEAHPNGYKDVSTVSIFQEYSRGPCRVSRSIFW